MISTAMPRAAATFQTNDTVRVATEAIGYRPDTSIVVTTINGKISPTIRLIPLTTNVAQPNAGPDDFALLAHPNPFSLTQLPQTQIVFRLPHREQVQIEIFNMLGQRVRELLNAPRAVGQDEILWDGTNDAGARVAAGVYILRLRAGKMSTTRRVTVAR